MKSISPKCLSSLLALSIGAVACAQVSPYTLRIIGPNATSRVAICNGSVVATLGNSADYWQSFGSTPIDLTPQGSPSTLNNVRNGRQVGHILASRDMPRASIWTGDATSCNALSHGAPSDAFDVSNDGTVVGYQWVRLSTATYYAWHEHSSYWDNNGNWNDIHPVGANQSRAYAISADASQIVGHVDGRATLWSGSNHTMISLGTPGYGSYAYAVNSGFQAGSQSGQAAMWHGSSSTYSNLAPFGYYSSEIYGMATTSAGLQEVGMAYDLNGNMHALLWLGKSGSVFDLNTALPAGYSGAKAFSIDSHGDIVGWAYPVGSSTPTAVEWHPRFGVGAID